MPTFKFFRSSKVLDEVVGADVGQIEAKLVKHGLAGSGITSDCVHVLTIITTGGGSASTSSSGYVLGSGKKVGAGAGVLQSLSSPTFNIHTAFFAAIAAYLLYTWWTKPPYDLQYL